MKKQILNGLRIVFCLGFISFLLACANNPTTNADVTAAPTDAPSEQSETNAAASSADGEWGASAQYFITHGVIDAGDYSADLYLTRIAAARMVADVTGLSEKAQNTSYSHPYIDLSEDSEQLIGFLYHSNIVEGVTNNHFMENEICDEDTFLVFLLRAIDSVGGETADVDSGNAAEIAKEAGILADGYINDDNTLSVNEAFDICYDALFAGVGGSGETLLSILTQNGTIETLESDTTADFSDAYEISWPSIQPFYQDDFTGSTLEGYRILDKSGSTCWYGGIGGGVQNSITESGCLEMSGKDQELEVNQQYALLKKYMQGNESYGMTFTVNVQEMPNEGNESRAIFRVIPRTADEAFTKYYAVNYYVVQQLGDYESNLIRCKWSVTNTNAPSGTAPLAEAFFLLKENVDYTARLLIENTEDGNVHIAFYIDGADRFSQNTEPLLEYTDSSEYKILQSATGPAFGISGNLGAGWGFAPCVHFDNVKLYDTQSFAALTQQLALSAETSVILSENETYADQLRYLVDQGVIMPQQRRLDFDANVSVKEFLATALYFNGEHMLSGQTLDSFVDSAYKSIFRGTSAAGKTDYERLVTHYEAAMIIESLLPGEPGTSKYAALYADKPAKAYESAVYFAVQNSYILLDDQNRFNGEATVSRSDLLRIFALAADARLRTSNSILSVASVYSDNAVVQGGKPIVITGRGMSGDTVTVSFGVMRQTAKVISGVWSVEFPAQPYGGPYALKVSDSGYVYKYKGIYVGEVVVVAGQSNAEMSIDETDKAKEILLKYGTIDKIRVFRPNSRVATEPVYSLSTLWEAVSDPYSAYIIGATSAIGVYYADQLLTLNADLKNVKIGIIQLTYGGTSIEMFMPQCVNEKNGFVQQDDAFIESGFWNGYMQGVTPYSASVLLYYQGENSTQLQYMYEPLLRDYIWGVRQAFCDDALPVLLVQISGYGDNYGQESDSWPYIREVQMRVANTMENVGIVTSIDLASDNPQEIHPTEKQPIGKRLAYLAMDLVYGKDSGMQSSFMTSCERSGSVYTIRFNTDALTLDETVRGTRDFEVLTADGTWVDAEAKVEGDALLVWSDEVIVPHGVRYAWSNYPKADLFDQNGLPVFPFNTTKDLYAAFSEDAFTTTSGILKCAYHLLGTGDAVVNFTRDNAVRHVKAINAYMLEYTDGDIPGQTAGDKVALLKKQQDDLIAEDGTDETVVKITAHGLKAGDWLYNVKYETMAQVLEVIDADTVRVERVTGQGSGNLFEVYRRIASTTAQK
ncbi:MAG TPA: sialate O-acetylesterase [Eubacteriales bacterium]|nr:sialate O-acetylesterase [Eubacteriales bacterium]